MARGTRLDRSAVGDGAAILEDGAVITVGKAAVGTVKRGRSTVGDGAAAVMTRVRVRKAAGLKALAVRTVVGLEVAARGVEAVEEADGIAEENILPGSWSL